MSDADENAENINRGGDDGYADHDENHDDYSDEGDAELKERKGTMSIADLYVPSHITKHRIVTGGRTPKQLQFLTEWHPGWTADISLAKSVIRKHPIESVYFVNYKPSWEPYSEYYDTITPNMIEDYKTDSGVKTFGSTIDKLVEDLSLKQRRSLKAEDIYPNYEFEYNEVSESDSGQDDHEVEGALTNPQIRKKKEDALKKTRQPDHEAFWPNERLIVGVQRTVEMHLTACTENTYAMSFNLLLTSPRGPHGCLILLRSHHARSEELLCN
jgi:hypothetical protein